MYNFLGYFQTRTIRKLILAVPKSLYPDVHGISMEDDFDVIPDTPEYFIKVYLNRQ